jgi:hypothetical protein
VDARSDLVKNLRNALACHICGAKIVPSAEATSPR